MLLLLRRWAGPAVSWHMLVSATLSTNATSGQSDGASATHCRKSTGTEGGGAMEGGSVSASF